jgi:lipopolysaccharide export system protein LptA
MAWTVERLRRTLVALAALLVLVLAGSVLYGRWRLRRATQDLPARLGLQIQQSTQGFVLSKSEGGRPLFTLRASRAVQFKAGSRVVLHQVHIDLYNQSTGVPDTISGDRFDYDPHAQIVRSGGEARIVLHSGDSTGGHTQPPVQLVTHDLTFDQKSGIAVCTGVVTFATGSASGQAVGATYEAKQARLVLESQIVLRASLSGGPAVVQATHAVYDRKESAVQLAQPRFVSGSGAQQSHGSASTALVALRPDHTARHVDATGAVELFSANGAHIQAPSLQLDLSDASRPRHASFTGGVQLEQAQKGSETSGHAATLQVAFDAQGHATNADLAGAVRLDQTIGSGAAASVRHLVSQQLMLHLTGAATNTLRSADATGDAKMRVVDGSGAKRRRSSIAAQHLHMEFAERDQVRTLTGQQQTQLTLRAADGTTDTSTGDSLTVDMLPRTGKSANPAAGPGITGQQIARAVQTGHVVLQQIPPHAAPSAGASGISTSTAARAVYHGATETLTLTGDPVFHNSQLAMTAAQMTVERASGDVIAVGGVQTTLLQAAKSAPHAVAPNSSNNLFGGDQPGHIIAERAVLHHATGDALFSGRARLWQGADSIEAPQIAISQKTRLLTASGPAACAATCVSATFLGTQTPPGAKNSAPQTTAPPQVFHVVSAKLVYSDAEREASFTGGVTVHGTLGVLRSRNASLLLAQSTAPNGQAGPMSVDKMRAEGGVRLLQPGRIANGEHLVYTAEDGRFTLTGTPAAPPKVSDAEHGTVSGRKLTFYTGTQEIMVTGAPGRPAETHTTVPKK